MDETGTEDVETGIAEPAECLDLFRRYLPEDAFEGIVDLHPEWRKPPLSCTPSALLLI